MAFLPGLPKSITKLQQVLNVATTVVSVTQKFDSDLMQLIHAELQCLELSHNLRDCLP